MSEVAHFCGTCSSSKMSNNNIHHLLCTCIFSCIYAQLFYVVSALNLNKAIFLRNESKSLQNRSMCMLPKTMKRVV